MALEITAANRGLARFFASELGYIEENSPLATLLLQRKLTDEIASQFLEVLLPSQILFAPNIFDFRGKNCFEKHDKCGDLICRIVAGRGYIYAGKFRNATFSFDKAAKSALWLRMFCTAVKCNGISSGLYLSLISSASLRERNNLLKDYSYTQRRLAESQEAYQKQNLRNPNALKPQTA
jgi:hypothetical protein